MEKSTVIISILSKMNSIFENTTGERKYTGRSSPLLFLSLLVVLTALFQTPAVFAQDELIVGVHKNFPPQYSIDEKTGEPVGFAIDIMDEVAKRSGLNVRYVVFDTWPELMQAFEDGQIDIIPNIGIIEERMDSMDFTVPVEAFHIQIFVRSSATEIHEIYDLEGRKVAVVKGNKGLFIMQEYGKANLVIYDSVEEAFLSLISGSTDALVYPEPVINHIAIDSGLEGRIMVVGEPLFEVKRGIAVQKGQPELLGKLDREVKAFIATPEYHEIYVKWYGKPEPYWTVKRVLVLGAGILAIIIVSMSGWYYNSLRRINKELTNSIAEQKKAEDKVKKLNQELEERVKIRTFDLESANNELVNFSYSASHDLRTPLRSIDGFSLALLEDYQDKLDEKGKDYLNRVRSAAQKMSELIDAMVNLLHQTRGEIKPGMVDMTGIVNSIVSDLQKSQPDRKVGFVIAENVTANGDYAMLRVVLENLFDNAWKFTKKHPKARIEFGVTEKDGKTVYFVRDDGAGFDPAYSDKLFIAFHRLHTDSDFMGIGIGLATVQRIIHRHVGEIWAEGEVEKGATFYFTLNLPT